jgi:hypothetical protein
MTVIPLRAGCSMNKMVDAAAAAEVAGRRSTRH